MKAFVIYLPAKKHSASYAAGMIDTLTDYGFDAELFEGTNGLDTADIFDKENRTLYPYSIKSKILDQETIAQLLKPELADDFWDTYDIQVTQKLKWTESELKDVTHPGVKGCFHSHFMLWRKCIELGEPVAIFEDDVKFYRPFEPVAFSDVLIVSLGKTAFNKEPYSNFLNAPTGDPSTVPWKNYSMPGTSGYMITPKAASQLAKHYKKFYLPSDNAINRSLVDIQIHTHLMGRNTLPEEGNISMTTNKDWQ